MTKTQIPQPLKQDLERLSELIQRAPIGKYIGREGAKILAEHACEEIDLKENDFLFRGGETTSSFFLIESGRLARVRESAGKANPSIVHVLQPGDLVGELSFIDDTEHSMGVMALTPARVLKFQKSDVDPLITEHPRLMFDFMRAVIKRVHHTVNDISRQQLALSEYIASGGKGRK